MSVDANASPTEEQPEEQPRGFQIRGRFYADPKLEKLGDPAIIREVTGLKWDDYQAAFGIPDPAADPDEQEPADVDEGLILAGMVALAVAHTNTGWNRARVVSFVTQLGAGEVELVGWSVEPEEGDDLPPTSESDELSPEPPEPMTASGEATAAETAEPSVEPQD